jgi:hypothetical protein
MRLAASCALDRRISQRPVRNSSNPLPAGRLLVQRGFLRRTRVSAASAITAVDLRTAIERLPLTAPAESREALERLHRALSILTTTLYRPTFESNAALDEALESGLTVTARLRRAHAWPRTLVKSRLTGRPAESVLR